MCGIVGAVSNAPVDKLIVTQMRESLVHRGPDYGGIWASENGKACFGHRRLAIIDLSQDANQPMVSHDGRFVITYNGEIYNYRELRKELKSIGTQFRTTSDTEVLLESYRRWGEKCLERLCGMFAFVIMDKVTQELFCARDRAGEKPFYYSTIGGSFIFASELKALLRWPGFRKEIHYPALIDYLTFGFVIEPKSIWEGCFKLAPGHWMRVKLNQDGAPYVQSPIQYWDFEFKPDYAVKDWSPIILDTLQKVGGQMVCADVPVGTFLSGGVDSSSVTAALSKSGHPVSTFTIGFSDQEYDERPWAKKVSDLYKTNHTEKLVIAEDVTEISQKMLWHYDEPFNDYSYLPTYYVCREARKDITVALSGDGADEILAGYLKYQRLGMIQSFRQSFPSYLTPLLSFGARLFPSTSRINRALTQYGKDSTTMLTDMMTLAFPYELLKKASNGALANALKDYSPFDEVKRLLQKAPPEKVGLINSMRYLDLKITLASGILVKVDRASMAVSLEVRPVYLHKDILDLAERIPSTLLADKSHSKEALKSALKEWLPSDLLYRKKMGFAMPLKKWLRGELGHIFENRNSNGRIREMFDDKIIDRIINEHVSGKNDLTSIVHCVYFLNSWMKEWGE